jgi:hypothetical protein
MNSLTVTSLGVKVRNEGNCGWVTNGGEEACGCMGKRWVCRLPLERHSPPGYIHVKAARLRTETWYKAGPVRRASTTWQSRSQTTDQVNHELVQRNITLLSGETCQAACEPSFAPTSKHLRLKGWNRLKQFNLGKAGVSRGRSTEVPIPMGTGRTKQ